MQTTTILHITDLHFGNSDSNPTGVVRDDEISKTLKEETTSLDCRNAFLAGIRRVSNLKVDVIACTGDFGSANVPGSMLRVIFL